MSNQLIVSGIYFDWEVRERWESCKPLNRTYINDDFEVLRISTLDKSLDLAIRVDKSTSGQVWLGPALVLSGSSPLLEQPIEESILIELRPKICKIESSNICTANVERIVQWLFSPKFRPIRVNSIGGKWVGYGT